MSEQPIIIETGSQAPDSCIIWLHGLGADGHDFEPIVPELRLSDQLNIRFIFPNAPMKPVTINQGQVMRSWYDIVLGDSAAQQDESGIRSSQQLLIELIESQITAGIDSSRIILAGFSQGGVIALQTGLRFTKPLAGIMALSTYLSLADSLSDEKTTENANIDIFLAHGSIDPVIPVSLAHQSRDRLETQGYKPQWTEYSGLPHSVSGQEISDIAQWIARVL